MHRPSSLVLSSALAAALLGCPKSPAGPAKVGDAGVALAVPSDAGLPQIVESEPDDSPETAQKLDRSCVVSGQIQAVQPATKPDEDWYIVRPDQSPRDLSAQLSYRGPPPAEPLSGGFVLEAYDRDHNRIESLSGTLTAGPLASLPTLRVRDVLFIRVAGHQAVFPYALRIDISTPDPNAEAEPNDRAVDATPLPLDHPIRGSYGSEDDKDYYVIEIAPDAGAPSSPTATATSTPTAIPTLVQPTEMLRLELTGIPGVRHSLTLFDDTQAPLASFASHEVGGPLMVRDYALRPGLQRLTLLLESAHRHKKPAGDFPSGQPYTLTVHRQPAPPDLELEPNDTLEAATPLVSRPAVSPAGLSAHRIGYLSPAGDVDDYRLHLDAPARVHVLLSALDRVDTELSVVEPEPSSAGGKTTLKVNEGGTKEPEVIPALTLPAGDHFIRVQAAAHQVGTKWVRDQEDPDQTYHLDVELMPDDGSFEREPNDTAAQATPILPGQTLAGFAFPARDVDVYRLDLSAQPIATGVSFQLTGVPKVPLALELRESQGGSLGELLNAADPGKPGADAQIQQKLDPGVYFLVVKPHPTSRSAGLPQSDSDTPYELTVQLQ